MSITTAARLQCRHILASGHRCASPTLRAEEFCYYHHTTRGAAAKSEMQARRGLQSTFDLPELEDRTSIQLAIAEILRRIAAHTLDTKRAGLLLYGLQIASCNLPRPTAQPAEQVAEITVDQLHGPIAPIAELTVAPRDKSLEQIFMERWEKDRIEEEARDAADFARDAADAAATIDLNAVAEPVPHDHANEVSVIVGAILPIPLPYPQTSTPLPAASHIARARLQPPMQCPPISPHSPSIVLQRNPDTRPAHQPSDITTPCAVALDLIRSGCTTAHLSCDPHRRRSA